MHVNNHLGITLRHLPFGSYLSNVSLTRNQYVCPGCGNTGQAGAIRHGLARAIVKMDPELRPIVKKAGYLTRDPRMKERINCRLITFTTKIQYL